MSSIILQPARQIVPPVCHRCGTYFSWLVRLRRLEKLWRTDDLKSNEGIWRLKIYRLQNLRSGPKSYRIFQIFRRALSTLWRKRARA
jgi:hypothetical protein